MSNRLESERRANALSSLIETIPSREPASGAHPLGDRWFDALTSLIVDATLSHDTESLRRALGALRPSRASIIGEVDAAQLAALHRVVRWALERSAGAVSAESLEPNSHPARMLRRIVAQPGLTNAEMEKALGLDKSEVSRSGTKLRQLGLADSRRLGRQNAWEASARGQEVVALWPDDPNSGSASPSGSPAPFDAEELERRAAPFADKVADCTADAALSLAKVLAQLTAASETQGQVLDSQAWKKACSVSFETEHPDLRIRAEFFDDRRRKTRKVLFKDTGEPGMIALQCFNSLPDLKDDLLSLE